MNSDVLFWSYWVLSWLGAITVVIITIVIARRILPNEIRRISGAVNSLGTTDREDRPYLLLELAWVLFRDSTVLLICLILVSALSVISLESGAIKPPTQRYYTKLNGNPELFVRNSNHNGVSFPALQYADFRMVVIPNATVPHCVVNTAISDKDLLNYYPTFEELPAGYSDYTKNVMITGIIYHVLGSPLGSLEVSDNFIVPSSAELTKDLQLLPFNRQMWQWLPLDRLYDDRAWRQYCHNTKELPARQRDHFFSDVDVILTEYFANNAEPSIFEAERYLTAELRTDWQAGWPDLRLVD
ncbi:MAG: hypothetical protein WC805_00920 [Patescibacteria group bacterium]|jgi:hypothetical protein